MSQPSLKDATDNFKGASLDDTTPDWLAAPYTDVDNTLKSKGKSISSMLVVIGRVHGWDEFWRAGVRRGKTVNVARTLRRGRA